ncbi:hypothetical protein MUK42_02840 [Musa troglodytarum]|uniref:Uncharacterized protein n=1 Tax=Musa troglodytarum TaxID=320322 RepID=A0A9E7EIA8_9LILI|nr:hypothetical protein MUK42_02840 [Musa troglodytarum]
MCPSSPCCIIVKTMHPLSSKGQRERRRIGTRIRELPMTIIETLEKARNYNWGRIVWLSSSSLLSLLRSMMMTSCCCLCQSLIKEGACISILYQKQPTRR